MKNLIIKIVVTFICIINYAFGQNIIIDRLPGSKSLSYPIDVQQLIFLEKDKTYYKNTNMLYGGKINIDGQLWHNDNLFLIKNGVGLHLSSLSGYTLLKINNIIHEYIEISLKGSNINLVLKQAYLMFGNLNESPIFFTIGKSSLPFGVFSGNTKKIDTITKVLFKPKNAMNFLLTYDYENIIFNVGYIFKNTINSNNNYLLSFLLCATIIEPPLRQHY